MNKVAALVVAAVLSFSVKFAYAEDPRYCGEPVRTEAGTIRRSSVPVYQFRSIYPCPSTGLKRGSCEGWAVDHVIPLACGGCDAVGNLQWLPNEIKSGKGTLPKDRWERKIYCVN